MKTEMTYDSTADTKAHIRRVHDHLDTVGDLLHARAVLHDKSKFDSPEKELFDEWTPKLKAMTYGGDEYKAALASLKPALDHHYAVNSHHPEHFRWLCAVCSGQFSDAQAPISDWGDQQHRFCPRCVPPGGSVIWEAVLVENPASGINGMTLLDLVEMFCDWKAATERHADGNIERSIKINRERFGLSDQLVAILENTRRALKW